MTIRELTAALGFEIDDEALNKFDAEISAVKAECAALSDRLKVAEQTAAEALEGMKNAANSAASALVETGAASENITETENAAVKAAEALSGVKENASDAASALEETSAGEKHLENTSEAAEKTAKALGGVKDNAEKSTKAFGEMKEKAGEAGNEIEKTKKKTDSLAASLNKIAKIVGGIFALGRIISFGKGILDTTGEVEQYRVTLGTMIGDQEKANKIIHDLDYSPVSDFYGTAAAIGGLQGMVTFGMQAEEASDTLTRLGDIAQGNGEAFKSLSLNMGQVFAKGKADATDLKQFVGQGFDVVGEVSEMTGKSRAEIEKAGISYEQCAAALRHITGEGGKYNGMLAKQSRTLPGLIKQFQSLSAAIKESIGTAVLDKVKDLMQYFLDLGRSIQDGIVSVGTRAFKSVLNAIADVIIAINLVKIEMERFGGAFTPIKAILEDVFGFFGSVFQSSIPFLMSVAEAILLAFKPIQAFVHPILEALKPLFKDVFGFGAAQVSGLLPYIDALTSSFQKAGEFIAKIIGSVDSVLGKHKKTIIEIAKVALAAFAAIKTGAKMSQVISSLSHTVRLLGTIGRHPQIILKRINGLKNGIGGLFKFVQKNPMILVAMAVVAALILIVTHLKEIKEWWANLSAPMKAVVGVIGGIVAAITAAFTAFRAFTAAVTVAKVVMAVFNAICAANPIVLIIMGVIAVIALVTVGIIALYKNWDTIKANVIKGAKSVGDFFKKVWNDIKKAFSASFGKIKENAQKALGGIKAAWARIKDFFASIWDGIVSTAKSVWNGLVNFFAGLIEGIKSVWNKVTGFFSGLWDGIVSVATDVWNGIVGVFSAVIESIKAVWNGITDFFGGLWESLKESVVGVADAIRDTFLGLFDGVKNQFFGFIDKIKDGWEKIKGFFGGLWDGAVNFFTGGGDGGEPTKVNDMILTPDGSYSTHPDDTIFAMKDPGLLVDRLAEFLAQSAPKPSYALAGSAASQAVRQGVSNDYSRYSSSSVFNTPIHVTVNAGGMSAEQARRAVEGGVRSALRDAIAGTRGTIPSPEARRA